MAVNITSVQNQGLNLVAYAGDQKILLAISIDENIVRQNNLAGFAIWRGFDRSAGGSCRDGGG